MSATSTVLPAVQLNVNYEDIKLSIRDFLTHFKTSSAEVQMDTDDDFEYSGPKYMALLQKIANRELSTLLIELDDLNKYHENQYFAGSNSQTQSSTSPNSLIGHIVKNCYRYVELFSSVVDELMPEPTKDISYKDDVLDVILHQRKLRNLRLQQDNNEEYNSLRDGFESNGEVRQDNQPADNIFPSKLVRRYCLYFKPPLDLSHAKALAVREVKGSYVGHLITVRGIVTRVSDVKPSVLVNAYTCDKCGFEIFQEVASRVFTPLSECNSPVCKSNNTKGQLFMSTRASKFSSFQEVKVQELANQVPVGHIPRTLTVHVNGDLVRSMNPGDVVDIAGIFMPAPYTGFRALKAGLLTETYLETQYVRQHKKQYESLELTDDIKTKIHELQAEGGVYHRLALSIAPEIYGHLDVKKILLLLLCGGVTKEIGDGLKIRGDINVCLMGDPGVAKSQLLRAVGKIAPRSVYTTGRGSSGVGLTAAVMRDPITDEMVLEGGALVLADSGVCCIDEFDKMDESDRTAIHEVMEQQTISISKAGINTTLNARTSILAAANPLYGRYNPRLSPHENINLPAALLSRFDIMYLMLDQPSREADERLAQHVAYVHMHNKQPETTIEPLDSATIRQYISLARTYRPVVPREVGQYVGDSYISMRKESKRNEGSVKKFSHITPRTVLGILRMAQALARIRFDNTVTIEDVDEALRLIQVSKSSLLVEDEVDREDTTTKTSILQTIRNMSQTLGNQIPMDEIRNRLLGVRCSEAQLKECIKEYEDYGAWQLSDDGVTLFIGDVLDLDMSE